MRRKERAERKTLLFIYNPHAGKGKIQLCLGPVVEQFHKNGYLPTLYATQGPGDGVWAAAALSRQYDHLVCCGGDGSLSEVVTGLQDRERPVTLGYIPAGTTNDFSKTLELPGDDMARAAELAVTGYPQDCDVGRVNGNHLFSYVAAFGIFTETSYATPQAMKNLFGRTAYILSGIKSLASLKTYHMKVTWDGGELEDEYIYGMVSNSVSVGGFKGMNNRQVILDDGLFEVVLIRAPKNLLDLNQVAAALMSRQPNEYIASIQSASVRFQSEEPVSWTLDGEFGGEHRELTVENLPRYVTILSGKQQEEKTDENTTV
ncbi:MAG: diacylglycerol kinase family lipid kinase [Clostridiales bacterium]|nr:diacylglycerol kinase family lipid kinase [Clostridiales bacterium]